jgi:DNA-binding CsgD family transcriptional regulator
VAANQDWPTDEAAEDLYTRLREGDPVAPADLAEAYFQPLINTLARSNPGIDAHLCYEAAGEAILVLIKNPKSYQPTRGTLDLYLRMSAQGDLRNLLEKERRHRRRRATFEVVELSHQNRNVGQEDSNDPAVIVERQMDEAVANTLTLPPSGTVSFTSQEAEVLALMRQGERRTLEFARVLGISELPAEQQRREVKRVKDRIKRRVERAEVRDG